MSYYLFQPDTTSLSRSGYSSVSRVPAVFSANWSYHLEASRYLREKALQELGLPGKVVKPQLPTRRTLVTYGQTLCNFLEWCDARDQSWRAANFADHILGGYQSDMLRGVWSVRGNSLGPRTVDLRVTVVCEFLSWAALRGLREPFSPGGTVRRVKRQSSSSPSGFIARDVFQRFGQVRPPPSQLRIPTDEEIQRWRSQLSIRFGKTKLLMADLVLATGIRREEVVQWHPDTLPRDRRQWRVRGDYVTVTIEQGTKGFKYIGSDDRELGPARCIDMPLSMAERIHLYRTFDRPALAAKFVKTAGDVASRRARTSRLALYTGYNELLRQWVTTLGLEAGLGKRGLHSHRFRKTLARLAALAVVGAPKILMDLFGHRSIAMTLQYILTDPQLKAEIQQVAKAQTIMLAEEAVRDHLRNGGPAAQRVKSAVQQERVRLGHEFKADDVFKLAEMLTLNGTAWQLVRPGVMIVFESASALQVDRPWLAPIEAALSATKHPIVSMTFHAEKFKRLLVTGRLSAAVTHAYHLYEATLRMNAMRANGATEFVEFEEEQDDVVWARDANILRNCLLQALSIAVLRVFDLRQLVADWRASLASLPKVSAFLSILEPLVQAFSAQASSDISIVRHGTSLEERAGASARILAQDSRGALETAQAQWVLSYILFSTPLRSNLRTWEALSPLFAKQWEPLVKSPALLMSPRVTLPMLQSAMATGQSTSQQLLRLAIAAEASSGAAMPEATATALRSIADHERIRDESIVRLTRARTGH